MAKIWSKILSFWPWLLIALVIILLLLWPTIVFEKYNGLRSFAVSKMISQSNHLIADTDKKPDIIQEKSKNILVFGGDIMLSRTVNAKMEKYKDYAWPFEKISSLFKEADIAVANLESPFLVTDNYQVLSGSFSFKANPKSVEALSSSGFDVLSLANNHILNQGKKGLADTRKILDTAGIDYAGPSDHNLVIKESQGVKFAFLAYTYNDGSGLIADIPDDFSGVKTEIELAKKQADVVIILMHAGNEYTRKPNKQQISFAHLAIDAGADLVVGHHPHWPQITENYKGKTIIYSLGNLVFDQMWSKETSVGLVAKIYFDGKEQINIEYIPINIKDYGQAEIMSDDTQKENLLKAIGVR